MKHPLSFGYYFCDFKVVFSRLNCRRDSESLEEISKERYTSVDYEKPFFREHLDSVRHRAGV